MAGGAEVTMAVGTLAFGGAMDDKDADGSESDVEDAVEEARVVRDWASVEAMD